ncbi:MAG: hypothetical protein M1469_07635 [Bacteroidetes bacterium]|nr:hypothetical protein [Bacteroidota bacterium]
MAIAVGISMFKSNAQSSNRDQVINDLNNLAAKAQQYYRKPTSMAGGGQSFAGFWLTPADTGNANGSYAITTSAPTTGTYATFTYSTGTAADSVTGGPGVTTMYITGLGTEKGNTGANHVEATVTITPDQATSVVQN